MRIYGVRDLSQLIVIPRLGPRFWRTVLREKLLNTRGCVREVFGCSADRRPSPPREPPLPAPENMYPDGDPVKLSRGDARCPWVQRVPLPTPTESIFSRVLFSFELSCAHGYTSISYSENTKDFRGRLLPETYQTLYKARGNISELKMCH